MASNLFGDSVFDEHALRVTRHQFDWTEFAVVGQQDGRLLVSQFHHGQPAEFALVDGKGSDMHGFMEGKGLARMFMVTGIDDVIVPVTRMCIYRGSKHSAVAHTSIEMEVRRRQQFAALPPVR